MIKRGWIEATKSIDVLEHQFLAFFGIQALDAEISFCHAAKKTAPAEMPTALQLAWLCQARRLASEMVTTLYSEAALRASLPRLSALLTAPEETRHVARILDACGVRFVVVAPIPGARIDGHCFWLPNKPPVVAMSLGAVRTENFCMLCSHPASHS